ncbi:metallophosphoesterase [Geomesophilobacter sediminis]|uniref:Metallophosphoesterase n=1 Tax=Geomesophilobacter sediminis TaxID=2798584 RepID=A0A8J7JLG0_9BACT|nr:metallophosphoesterase [Geomesophilobacter sediminis]MBJ6724850.1 metallophosphoesterase [Geomesophilobacter sediminis]
MTTAKRPAMLISAYLDRERYSVRIVRYRVPVAGLPAAFDGFTILQLSDLHDKEFEAGGKALLELLAREPFDLVVFTGDLVLGPRYRLTPALDLVQGLARVPVFSVSGNHDWGESGHDHGIGMRIKQALEEAGARVLSNQGVCLERDGARLWITGVDDPVTGKDRLNHALAGIPSGERRLLLAHSPHIFPRAAAASVDLVLAGHTHGGQIRLPGLRAVYVPKLGFFPRWDYGFFRHGTSALVVNAGLGESWLPVRWNIPPEVTLVTLVAS